MLTEEVVMATLTIVLFLMTTMCNVVVLVLVSRTPVLHTCTNATVISFCCAEIMTSFSGMVFMALTFIFPVICENRKLCRVFLFFTELSETSALLSIFVLCLDRLLAVTRPFRYTSLVTRKSVGVAIIVTWLYSALWNISPLISADQRSGNESCLTCVKTFQFVKIYITIFTYFLPFCLCTVSVGVISYEAFSRRRITAIVIVPSAVPSYLRRSTKKALKSLVKLIGSYLTLTFPEVLATILWVSNNLPSSYQGIILSARILSFVSGVVLPVVIITSNNVYKDKLRTFSRCSKKAKANEVTNHDRFSISLGVQRLVNTYLVMNGVQPGIPSSPSMRIGNPVENSSVAKKTIPKFVTNLEDKAHHKILRKTNSLPIIRLHSS